MKGNYKPQKLNLVLADIAQKHPLKTSPPEFKSDQAFVAMLKQWAYMANDELTQEVPLIPPRRIRQLVEYVSSNSLHLPMHNFTIIIRSRATDTIIRRLFSLWLDNYERPDFNKLLDIVFQGNYNLVEESFSDTPLTTAVFLTWIRNSNIPIAVGKSCMQIRTNSLRFESAMQSYMVSPESLLGKACIENFYTFCAKDDYLLLKDFDLERILRRYQTSQIHAFLHNFLTHLSVQDFQRFYVSGKYLVQRHTNRPGTKPFQVFFAPYPHDLVSKYSRWLDYITIRDSFHNNTTDVRLIFWSRFVPYMESAHMEAMSRALIMRFEHYVIVEFTEATMGALYIYEKEDFDKRIQYKARVKNNTEFRSYLYNSPSVERIVHNGNWQGKTEWYLRRNRIAKK